jgi:hypothetical protein
LQIISIDDHISFFNESVFDEYKIIEKQIVSNRRGEVNQITWRGVKLTEILEIYNITDEQVIVFSAVDKYRITLTNQQIIEFDPIIAIERNGQVFSDLQFRLVAENTPDMYRIANLTSIEILHRTPIVEPTQIITCFTILDKIRLIADPAPFTGVRGYRFRDILRYFDADSRVDVRIVSIDGMEQTLPFIDYYQNAVLVVDGDRYNVQSPDMPNGMWQKDVMLIDIAGDVIFFYKQVDTEKNKSYLEFIELISQRERMKHTADGMEIIKNWKEIRWENVLYIK